MANKELTAYYQQVAKAEDLLYFIQQAEQEVQTRISAIVLPYVDDDQPAPKGYDKYRSIHAEAPCELVTIPTKTVPQTQNPSKSGVGTMVAGWVCGCFGVGAFKFSAFLGVVLILVGVLLIASGLGAISGQKKQIVEDAENKWKRDRLRIYKDTAKANEAGRLMRSSLQDEWKTLSYERQQVTAGLTSLYEDRSIPMQVRSMVAAHSILDYLEMGICSELEGPQGAYAKYMDDVRANRICDKLDMVVHSVRSLSAAVYGLSASIKETQASLCARIKETHDRMDVFEASVQEDMALLQKQKEITQESLKGLKSTADVIAWNQYIAAERQGITGTWMP